MADKRITNLKSSIDKPRGSIDRIISDITKGSGCPDIKDPMKRYNVLKYFSIQRWDDLPSIGGVVGDGGCGGNAELTPSTSGGDWVVYKAIDGGGFVKYRNNIRNINLNIIDLAINTYYVLPPVLASNFNGRDRFLNISNFREVTSNTIQYFYPTVIGEPFNSTYSDTIKIEDDDNAIVCHIVNDNELRTKTGDYYEYNLLKTNHTMDITPAGTETPVSKTADLMEFVFLHVDIPPCKEGDLYIELEDTDITGSTTNDWLVYFYYWESNRNESNLSSQIDNGSNLMSSNPNLRYLDNDNEPRGVARISRLAGQTGNKFVLWLNRFKAKGERFSVNILIGLNPEELRNDYVYYNNETVASPFSGNVPYHNDRNETPTDLVLKFSKASVKIKKHVDFDSLVRPFPCWGYKLLDAAHSTLENYVHIFRLRMYPIDSSYNSVSDSDPAKVGYGLADYGPTQSVYTREAQFFMFYKTDVVFQSGKNYILRLPNFVSFLKVIQFPFVSWPGDSYYVIKIYAGNTIDKQSGSTITRQRTFFNNLTLMASYTVSDLSEFITQLSGNEDKKYYKYKYLEFSGEDVGVFAETYFYFTVEPSSYQIDASIHAFESGIQSYDTNNLFSDDKVFQYYFNNASYPDYGLTGVTSYNFSTHFPPNLGVSLFAEEKFILKNEQAEQDNYFS